MKTLKELCKEALDVQDACNLTGVLKSFDRTMGELRLLAREEGWEGTEAINRHPVAILFSSKIASLTGSEDGLEFSKAYDSVSKVVES